MRLSYYKLETENKELTSRGTKSGIKEDADAAGADYDMERYRAENL